MSDKSEYFFTKWLHEVNEQNEEYFRQRNVVYESFWRWAFEEVDMHGLPDYILDMVVCYIEAMKRDNDFSGMYTELRDVADFVKEAYEAGYRDAKKETDN